MGTGKADFIKIAHLLVGERGNEQGGERQREKEPTRVNQTKQFARTGIICFLFFAMMCMCAPACTLLEVMAAELEPTDWRESRQLAEGTCKGRREEEGDEENVPAANEKKVKNKEGLWLGSLRYPIPPSCSCLLHGSQICWGQPETI